MESPIWLYRIICMPNKVECTKVVKYLRRSWLRNRDVVRQNFVSEVSFLILYVAIEEINPDFSFLQYVVLCLQHSEILLQWSDTNYIKFFVCFCRPHQKVFVSIVYAQILPKHNYYIVP